MKQEKQWIDIAYDKHGLIVSISRSRQSSRYRPTFCSRKRLAEILPSLALRYWTDFDLYGARMGIMVHLQLPPRRTL